MKDVRKLLTKKRRFIIIKNTTYMYLIDLEKNHHRWSRMGNLIKNGELMLYIPKCPFLFFLIGFEIPDRFFNLIEKVYLWYYAFKYIKNEIK